MPNQDRIDFAAASAHLFKTVRSGETLHYLNLIINTIESANEEQSPGMIRAKDLQSLCVGPEKIPHVATYFRLLKKLVENQIVQEITVESKKSGPGRRPKYYFLGKNFSPMVLMSREELLGRAIFLENQLRRCESVSADHKLLYKACRKILEEHNIQISDEIILTNVEKIRLEIDAQLIKEDK